ncbi:hypothetical protein N0B44_00215 [Roseibacterium beibuensis]|uniref:Uncharacterized protein n=1 Tax=[Roseibacterium] beibuensis TaxID=1193142 RepID=A0ABP9L6E8_9RHOB|nr:hypothetical protein [Roseibacterium beibuensis]MCS6621324.1 hypothetical protein [Roseibacterium beibuensis]
MRDAAELTFWDFWPFYVIGAMAIFAVIVVFRGLNRRPDSSDNSAAGGGSDFMGKGGRW